MDVSEKVRTAERLLSLRQTLRSDVLERAGRDPLLIATWNLRDFDSNRYGHGPRLRESFYYIAEIVSTFDLVAIQEVNRNLDALEALLSILGPEWDYIATDAIEGPSGSEERIAFVYRQSKLIFRKIAGEVVLPGGQQTVARQTADHHDASNLGFWRTPYLAGFQAAGGFNFNLCVLHLCYEGMKAQVLDDQSGRLDAVARFLKERQARDREDYVLIGDFGVGAPSDLFARSLDRHGFSVPEALTRRRAGLNRELYYDQIAFRHVEDRLELAGSGSFRPFETVFRDNEQDFAAYRDLMPEEKANDLWNGGPESYYANQWRTWQISDHTLLWAALKVDFSDHLLDSIRKTGLSS